MLNTEVYLAFSPCMLYFSQSTQYFDYPLRLQYHTALKLSYQRSPSVSTLLSTFVFVSSAHFSTLLVILSSKSLIYIYIKNNKGPNTDPCGTPLKTYFLIETSPSTTTRCLLQSAIVLSSRICHPLFHELLS